MLTKKKSEVSPKPDPSEDTAAFLNEVIKKPFGMLLFYVEGSDKKAGVKVAHIFKYDDCPAAATAVGASHVAWQMMDTYTAEELSEMLLDRNVMTFLTETEGRG